MKNINTITTGISEIQAEDLTNYILKQSEKNWVTRDYKIINIYDEINNMEIIISLISGKVSLVLNLDEKDDTNPNVIIHIDSLINNYLYELQESKKKYMIESYGGTYKREQPLYI